jgi:hypothetical protein
LPAWLGLDTSHFTGQRRWSDAQLRRAVATAYSWSELLSDLGLNGSADDRTRVKAHAVRLGLDLGRLGRPDGGEAARPEFRPDLKHLREAGAAIATMWFLLCGYNVSLPRRVPFEGCVTDGPDGPGQAKSRACQRA